VLRFGHESFQSFTCTAADNQEIKHGKMQNNGTQSELVKKNTHTHTKYTEKKTGIIQKTDRAWFTCLLTK